MISLIDVFLNFAHRTVTGLQLLLKNECLEFKNYGMARFRENRKWINFRLSAVWITSPSMISPVTYISVIHLTSKPKLTIKITCFCQQVKNYIQVAENKCHMFILIKTLEQYHKHLLPQNLQTLTIRIFYIV